VDDASDKKSSLLSKLSKEDRQEIIDEIMTELLENMEQMATASEKSIQSAEGDIQTGADMARVLQQAKLFNSVIRVHSTHSEPNFGTPWQRNRQGFSTSTGFVISGNRILTNAHSVEYGSLIQVKKQESEEKYVASVIAVGHECDLALLKVEDPEFWEGLEPTVFGEMPDLQDEVSVVGFPVGGDSISVSSGVVSRIEMQEYVQASAELLAIQIDAAINSGNSGGPVVNSENQVIGVAFQSFSSSDVENIGYLVPVNVVYHFLEDVERHGCYSGVPAIGVRLQPMENAGLRRHFQMKETDTGVLVLSVAPLAPAAKLLQRGDVILAVDDVPIANDGSVPFREGGRFKERVQWNYHITQTFPGDAVTVKVLRDGKEITFSCPIWIPDRLVPRALLQKNRIDEESGVGTGSNGSIVGGTPSYMVVGGLVLTALSHEYLTHEFDTEHMDDFELWADEYRLLALADTVKTRPDEEVVMLAMVIAHNCNIGYEKFSNHQLLKFNGEEVRSLRHLKQVVDTAKASGCEQLVFEFTSGRFLVLDAKAAFAAQEEILREHFIPADCSSDLTEPTEPL
jgi:S1-C subfamily serine protease